MNSNNEEHHAFRLKLLLTVIKNSSVNENEYFFTVYYNETTNDTIKITIINATTDVESYTSIITRTDYDDLKMSQNLIINFEELFIKIKTLLTQYEEKKIKMRLTITESILLGFYTMSDLKELTILIIPFNCTSTQEIITYLRNKISTLEVSNKLLIDKNNKMEKQCTELSKKCEKTETELNHMYGEQRTVEDQIKLLERKNAFQKTTIDELIKRNETIKKDLRLSETRYIDLNETVSVLGSDVESLKIGIEYYVMKTKHLQTVLMHKEKNSVPTEKYEKLYNMFCSAVADLIKYQVNLKKILSLHDLQKSENQTLKEELTNCIDNIKQLEQQLNETKAHPITEFNHRLNQVNEMIQNLEVQSTAVQQNFDK